LIKVSGIGPKVALKILSGAPLGTIVQMIEEGNVKGLSQLPKVGKKTAEQIVLELKGKLVLADEQRPRSTFSARSDIISALVNLGFKVQDVEKVVDQMEVSTDFEEGLRKGLSTLTGNF
jgi:Holliday junction DNA helicase RuvA